MGQLMPGIDGKSDGRRSSHRDFRLTHLSVTHFFPFAIVIISSSSSFSFRNDVRYA